MDWSATSTSILIPAVSQILQSFVAITNFLAINTLQTINRGVILQMALKDITLQITAIPLLILLVDIHPMDIHRKTTAVTSATTSLVTTQEVGIVEVVEVSTNPGSGTPINHLLEEANTLLQEMAPLSMLRSSSSHLNLLLIKLLHSSQLQMRRMKTIISSDHRRTFRSRTRI